MTKKQSKPQEKKTLFLSGNPADNFECSVYETREEVEETLTG